MWYTYASTFTYKHMLIHTHNCVPRLWFSLVASSGSFCGRVERFVAINRWLEVINEFLMIGRPWFDTLRQ